MAERSPNAPSTAVLTPGIVIPLPSVAPGSTPVPYDSELDAIAEDLETVVDSRSDRMRRVADVVLSAAGILVLTPVMLAVAAAVKMDSPGPVLYTQDRVGINRRRRERRRDGRGVSSRRVVLHAGRPFRIYKFRTMRTDAEAAGPQWASQRDPRITRVGRVLRKARLDEIPQFINVLRGDMTLIGPRPERPFFVELLQGEVPHYSKRLLVKPGITGMAQVHHKYDDSVESVRTKVRWDLRYIRQRGPKSDFAILLRTIRTVLTGEGAC
jgi:lipopolysaccharide/colanic/teichoic acid biosynthesis glycosyltransferase